VLKSIVDELAAHEAEEERLRLARERSVHHLNASLISMHPSSQCIPPLSASLISVHPSSQRTRGLTAMPFHNTLCSAHGSPSPAWTRLLHKKLCACTHMHLPHRPELIKREIERLKQKRAADAVNKLCQAVPGLKSVLDAGVHMQVCLCRCLAAKRAIRPSRLLVSCTSRAQPNMH
jgi:hypothetical protein